MELVFDLYEENYDQTLSDHQFWMGTGATHGWIPDSQLYNDILASMKPELVHPDS
jgi:hypothetical protein